MSYMIRCPKCKKVHAMSAKDSSKSCSCGYKIVVRGGKLVR